MSKLLLFVSFPSASKPIIQDCSIPSAFLIKETVIVTQCKAKLSKACAQKSFVVVF